MLNSPPMSPALVGREREQAQLAALIRVAAEGVGGLVVVSGEAGVGKTALVDASLTGSPLLTVRAAASALATPPLGPVIRAAHALRREAPEAYAEVAAAHPLFQRLVSGDQGPGTAAGLDELLRAAVGALCDLARGRAFVLVLEDLQWADRATLELACELAQEARRAPLLVVLVHRSDIPRGHPVRALRETLRRARILHEISVEPLDRPEALHLAGRLLGDGAAADAALAVVERSAGIPLFIEAVAAALRERGDRCAAGNPGQLPANVRDAILERVDLLPPAGRRAAEAAAVAGAEFALPMLVQLNGGEDGIELLLQSGLLEEHEAARAAFRSSLVREAIHAAIPWTRRRALHRRAAEAIVAACGGIEQAAEHWQVAGDGERARDAWLQAATRSRRLHAHGDAVMQLRRALDLWPPEQRPAEGLAALEQLGDSAQLSHLFDDALHAWREVADTAANCGDALAGARARRKIAILHELNCEWARALDVRQDAAAAFAELGHHDEAAADLFAASVRLRYAGQYAAALVLLTRAAAAATEGGRSADLAVRIDALRGNVLARSGRVTEGIELAREALAAALARGRADLAGECYQRLADSIERTGEMRHAVDAYREGADLCERNGLPVVANACLMCLSYALFRSGAWDDALATARRVLASEDADPLARAGANAVAALVHVQRGELRRAGPFLAAAGARSRQVGSVTVEFVSRWAHALHDTLSGSAKTAADSCLGVLARWRQTEEGGVATPVLRWASTCLAEAGDRDGVRACADALGEIAGRLGHADTLSALAHGLGEHALLDGQPLHAAEQFAHAAALLDGRAFPLERAHSQWRGAVACAATGRTADAVALLRDAARGAQHLDARPLAEAVARQLRALGQPLAGALGPRSGGRAQRGGLTARQAQVLSQIATGLTDKEVARALNLSPRTVEMHVARALAALDCRSRVEAVRKLTELERLDSESNRH